MSLGLGIGVAGHGVSEPDRRHTWPPLAERRDWCAANDHPGSTFNPWSSETWCLCGSQRVPGNTVVWPLPMQCGGPLTTCLHAP